MAPNADGTPTPDEQAAIEAQMKAPKEPQAADTKEAYDARSAELQTALDAKTREVEAANRRAQDAESQLAAVRSGQVPARASRQVPIWYVVKADHASQTGDITSLVNDINEECKDIPGFAKLSVADFLALNIDSLDADAQARGFSRGARWSTAAENGDVTSGYHLFVGQAVLAGSRDTAAAKPKVAATA